MFFEFNNFPLRFDLVAKENSTSYNMEKQLFYLDPHSVKSFSDFFILICPRR